MFTLAGTMVLLVIIAGCCTLLVIFHNQQKRKMMSKVLNLLSRVGSQYNLSFSSQEILKRCAFGLDGLHRKILVMKNGSDELHAKIIDLNEVSACSVKKTFGSIDAGELQNKNLEQYLQKIVLQFEFRNNKLPVEIPFFDREEQNLYPLPTIEKKAKHWQTILTKMIVPMKNTA